MREKKILGGKEKVKVAVIQAAPVFMDKEKTIEKACGLIREAGNNGAELIAFPEVFIPGYPSIHTSGWESKPTEWAPYMIALQDNAVLIGSEDTEVLGEAARDANAYVAMGCNELDPRPGSRTVYNTLVFIGRDGKVMGTHRKLMPTYTERTYWGMGDGSDLKVFDTEIGRMGGLICGENTMILLKAAMIQKGEDFHITLWPGAWSRHRETHLLDPETDAHGGSCMIYPTIRSYAIDSQAFVLSANGILGDDDFPEKWKYLINDDHTNYSWTVGGSAIVNPSGVFLSGPLIGEETILYSYCEANQIKLAKALTDCLGHYTRWDVVRLQVRGESWTPEIRTEGGQAAEIWRNELARIADKYEISEEKLLVILEDLNTGSSNKDL